MYHCDIMCALVREKFFPFRNHLHYLTLTNILIRRSAVVDLSPIMYICDLVFQDRSPLLLPGHLDQQTIETD